MLKRKYVDLLKSNFNNATLRRGEHYHQEALASITEISENSNYIEAEVLSNTSEEIYSVNIKINWSNMRVSGSCSCPMGHNCKHVAASLIEADDLMEFEQDTQPNPLLDHLPKPKDNGQALETSTAFENWIQQFDRQTKYALETDTELTNNNGLDNQAPKKNTPHVEHLLYALDQFDPTSRSLHVNLKLARVLKKGGYGKPKNLSLTAESHQRHLRPEDLETISALKLLNQLNRNNSYNEQHIFLTGQTSASCLEKMLTTGRCIWQDDYNTPLSLGERKTLKVHWELLPDAHQRLHISVDDKPVTLLHLDKLWYLNFEKNICGPLETNMPGNLLEHLTSAPNVPPQATEQLKQSLEQWAPNPSFLPRQFEKIELIENQEITPEIRFKFQKIDVPIEVAAELNPQKRYFANWNAGQIELETLELSVAEVIFHYEGTPVPFSISDPKRTITFLKNDSACAFSRDFAQEESLLIQLKKIDAFSECILLPEEDENKPDKIILSDLRDEDDRMEFSISALPELEKNGWRVVREDEHFAEILHDDDLEWYSELDESSEYDYFSYRMGILIENEPIDILPLVSKIMRTTSKEYFASLQDNEQVTLSLDNGKVLSVPYSRIKPVLNILIELYDTDLGDGSLQISKRQAALIAEIEKAFQASKMRWMGGEKLRTLGKQLASFDSIKEVKVPPTFKATLRQYQQFGVNWLQFLREYQLGGILADDMGLGKTIQTLAHLSIEKSKGRLKKPSLIIAPTSLMHNWKEEAAKFTPHLKTLVFHGDERHSTADQIKQAHLVFTTYQLLLRDKKLLLDHEFYYLILDEAQFIKNHKAKSTQIAQQIKAEHRLCLTGTPMENHLLELWSLFHFLMPGFLGNVDQFKKVFRTPIEKQGDAEKQQSLSKRITPFLLRRKKNDVLQDLPEKTEVIQKVEVTGAQRDLYESIRLSMEKKVRDAISRQGVRRSHIIILDALLKLRQTCCDPRLLKLESAKKAAGCSAKLELLMDMLPNMVEEGQKILIFSQFTKMLSIIEEKLTEATLPFVKLTGATKNRQKPINAFQNGSTPIFLISLKAGGTGLNLTAADTVIHYDPWWNPAVEDQATDRAHRMGQQKSVFVYKLIAAGTVEETIQEMQQKKRKLVEGLFTDTDSSKLSLASEDLTTLFKPI